MMNLMQLLLKLLYVCAAALLWSRLVDAFSIVDYTHYLDYLPNRMEGATYLDDFRTKANPPPHIRDRKMEIGSVKLQVEDVLLDPVWPSKWPYSFEDFRPLDYTRDEVTNTAVQYSYSQRLIDADHIIVVPLFLRLPVKRHFLFPKDRLALSDHLEQYLTPGAKVLELFSCYESALPSGIKLGPVVGVGWSAEEMKCNAALDDFIEQDVTVDPFLPLEDNYFDVVVVPAMFQLFQRPQDMMREINRVLKPGGRAVMGVKLTFWSFLNWKQGRYFVETSYLDDVLALGSFFHYCEGGFTKPRAFDLTLPELNPVGRLKDRLFPSPRLDFYACVEARKRTSSPYGRPGSRPPPEDVPPGRVEGLKYRPKMDRDFVTNKERLSPFY